MILFCIKYRISGGIDVCKNFLETKFRTVVLFLTICKFDQNICSWPKKILADRLVLPFWQ